jgi:hypothetical protein
MRIVNTPYKNGRKRKHFTHIYYEDMKQHHTYVYQYAPSHIVSVRRRQVTTPTKIIADRLLVQ